MNVSSSIFHLLLASPLVELCFVDMCFYDALPIFRWLSCGRVAKQRNRSFQISKGTRVDFLLQPLEPPPSPKHLPELPRVQHSAKLLPTTRQRHDPIALSHQLADPLGLARVTPRGREVPPVVQPGVSQKVAVGRDGGVACASGETVWVGVQFEEGVRDVVAVDWRETRQDRMSSVYGLK
jgi:hypothetical protein